MTRRKTKFYEYVTAMNKAELEDFADRAGVSFNYISKDLKYAYKKPREELWDRIVDAANGELTDEDMFDHFHTNRRKLKKEKADAA